MQSKFSKSTDTAHKETLQSSIAYANWQAAVAHGDSEVGFEVKTVFVGEGAAIKIKGKSDKGKTLGKVAGVVSGNYYAGTMPIPDNIQLDDSVFFEVELSKHGLKETSNRIPAGPPVKIKNMKWDKKEARRGDIVKLTADIDGVKDYSEVTIIIYEFDNDGNHDKIVALPTTVKNKKIELLWEYEYHEDTDDIPTNEQLQKYGKSYNPPEYYFVIEVDYLRFGDNQESGLLEFKDYLEIRMRDRSGQPAANIDFVATLPDGQQQKGKLDANGYARITGVPPGTCKIDFPSLGSVQKIES